MSSNTGTFLNQENIIKKVFDASTDSLRVLTAPAIGAATEAKQDISNASLASIDSKLTLLNLAVFQASPLISTNITNIPASSSLPLQLIATSSQITKEIQIVEDIGEYMALYTGAASSEVFLCATPLGGGVVKVNIPAGTRISIRSLNNVAISLVSNLIINLVG